jgi:hypothetical protein
MLPPRSNPVNGRGTPRAHPLLIVGVPTEFARKLAPPELLQRCCTEAACHRCGLEIMVVAARLEQVAARPVLVLCLGCAEAAAAERN